MKHIVRELILPAFWLYLLIVYPGGVDSDKLIKKKDKQITVKEIAIATSHQINKMDMVGYKNYQLLSLNVRLFKSGIK